MTESPLERRRVAVAQQRSQGERDEALVLDYLSRHSGGLTLAELDVLLGWPGGTIGVVTVLHRLRAEGGVHLDGERWREGAPAAPVAAVKPPDATEPIDGLVLAAASTGRYQGEVVSIVANRSKHPRADIAKVISRMLQDGRLVMRGPLVVARGAPAPSAPLVDEDPAKGSVTAGRARQGRSDSLGDPASPQAAARAESMGAQPARHARAEEYEHHALTTSEDPSAPELPGAAVATGPAVETGGPPSDARRDLVMRIVAARPGITIRQLHEAVTDEVPCPSTRVEQLTRDLELLGHLHRVRHPREGSRPWRWRIYPGPSPAPAAELQVEAGGHAGGEDDDNVVEPSIETDGARRADPVEVSVQPMRGPHVAVGGALTTCPPPPIDLGELEADGSGARVQAWLDGLRPGSLSQHDVDALWRALEA